MSGFIPLLPLNVFKTCRGSLHWKVCTVLRNIFVHLEDILTLPVNNNNHCLDLSHTIWLWGLNFKNVSKHFQESQSSYPKLPFMHRPLYIHSENKQDSKKCVTVKHKTRWWKFQKIWSYTRDRLQISSPIQLLGLPVRVCWIKYERRRMRYSRWQINSCVQ
jgi:hypothetical protein